MTALPDLIELSGLASFTTYGYSGANQILGVVDNATYTGDDDNGPGEIVELNDTAHDGGILAIGGVNYTIDLAAPDGDPVVLTFGDGSTRNVTGGGFRSDVVFITAMPVGGGAARFFVVFEDALGDLPNIMQISTGRLDFDPAGDDVRINLEENNNVGVVCFAAGTMIDAPGGARPVEGLRAGDLVLTADHGAQPVRWIGRASVDAVRDPRVQRLLPVLIRADALAPGYPERDLLVSPQHRMLVNSPVAARMFGAREVLVPAVKLAGHPGIGPAPGIRRVTYHHMLLDRHEIVFANGAPAETMLRGQEALRTLSRAAILEIEALFPEQLLEEPRHAARPVRQAGHAILQLVRRHALNLKPLLDPERVCRAG